MFIGIGAVIKFVWEPSNAINVAFPVANEIPEPIESTYSFVTASVEIVGVPKPVILNVFMDKLPVGAKIDYNGVVYYTNLASL